MKLTLKEIAELVGGSIEGDSSISIQGIGALDSANSSQISYAVNEKYRNSLKNSNQMKKYSLRFTSMILIIWKNKKERRK